MCLSHLPKMHIWPHSLLSPQKLLEFWADDKDVRAQLPLPTPTSPHPAESKLSLTTFSTQLIGIHLEMKRRATPVQYKRQELEKGTEGRSRLYFCLYRERSTPMFHTHTSLMLFYLGCFFTWPTTLPIQAISKTPLFLSWGLSFLRALLTSCSPRTLYSNGLQVSLSRLNLLKDKGLVLCISSIYCKVGVQ